jgi:glycerophosphoryl diester phosphodiesterase
MARQKRKPLVFAHRGASAYAPENTLPAFELAIQQGADFVELDAKLCADQRVVIVHDHSVDRTTDGAGRVSELTYQQLQELNACYSFQERYPQEKVPLLEEVLELCAGRIGINIELGNYFTPLDNLAAEVARIIKNHGLQEEVLVSAFHPISLRRFHAQSPQTPLAFLARRGWQGYLSRSWLGRALVPYQALHPEKSDITPGLMAAARKHGYSVHPFTVNEAEEMRRLIALGVDGLITDDPRLARSQVD